MGRAVAVADDPGPVDRDRAERLGGDALGPDAAGGQRGAHGAHERVGAAEVVVGVDGHAGPFEDGEVETAGDVVVGAAAVAGGRPAVGDHAVGVGERGEQRVDLGAEGVVGAVAGAVEPPDRPRRGVAGERVEHREHRRRADAGAEQDDRPVARPQDEGAARGRDLEHVPDAHGVVQPAAGRAVALDADPEAASPGTSDSE